MEFIDLHAQQQRIRENIDARIRKKVLNHGQYILGPEIKQLESKLATCVAMKKWHVPAGGKYEKIQGI